MTFGKQIYQPGTNIAIGEEPIFQDKTVYLLTIFKVLGRSTSGEHIAISELIRLEA